MKNEKNNIFSFFSEKYVKISKKVKNDENGSDIDKKRSKLMNIAKNNIFPIFSEEYGKMSKKVKNDENGSDIDKKGQN